MLAFIWKGIEYICRDIIMQLCVTWGDHTSSIMCNSGCQAVSKMALSRKGCRRDSAECYLVLIVGRGWIGQDFCFWSVGGWAVMLLRCTRSWGAWALIVFFQRIFKLKDKGLTWGVVEFKQDLRGNFLSQRVVRTWNELPVLVIKADNDDLIMMTFKRHLDRYIRRESFNWKGLRDNEPDACKWDQP